MLLIIDGNLGYVAHVCRKTGYLNKSKFADQTIVFTQHVHKYF